jgi:hypothetical protein
MLSEGMGEFPVHLGVLEKVCSALPLLAFVKIESF